MRNIYQKLRSNSNRLVDLQTRLFATPTLTSDSHTMLSLRSFFRLLRWRQRNVRFLCSVILVAFVVARIFYNNQLGLKDLRTHVVERLQSPKLILVYGPTRSYEPWGPINSHEAKNYKFVDWDGTPCEETRCRITFDKKLLPFSDAVLVHHNWMQIKRIEEELLRIKRPLEQRWVFYTKESP